MNDIGARAEAREIHGPTMPQDEPNRPARRERSARYPGVPIAEALELARFVDERGLDGLGAGEIAQAAGYRNVKTNTFSARLSAARQFGLLSIRGKQYELTPLARSILHPTDPAQLPKLRRRAFLTSPLYSELCGRLADKKAPGAEILGNMLYHHHDIIASAKDSAAASFLESARFVGILGEDGIVRATDGRAAASEGDSPKKATKPAPGSVRIDLRLWGPDEGKTIRVRCPESISAASFERLLQAFRLHVRVEGSAEA